MSNSNIASLRALVYFAGLRRQISMMRIDHNDSSCTGAISAGVLTIVGEQATHRILKSTGEWVDSSRVVLTSALWAGTTVGALMEVLIRGITDPLIWVMGEFLSSDSEKLEQSGLFPDQVPLPVTHGHKLQAMKLILRLTDPSRIILPSEQGCGHMATARIAIFSGREEPIQLYDEWLAAVRKGTANRFDRILTIDDCMPEEAVGWLAPFGEEDRNHALIAKAGVEPHVLAAQVAERLGLPLLTSHCGEDEFHAWEDWHTPPEDLARQL